MLRPLHIVCEKGGMEDGVNLPLEGNAEVEGRPRDDLLNFKQAGSFHLEFLGSVHVKISGLQPDLVSYLPRGEFGGYLLPHSLLG